MVASTSGGWPHTYTDWTELIHRLRSPKFTSRSQNTQKLVTILVMADLVPNEKGSFQNCGELGLS